MKQSYTGDTAVILALIGLAAVHDNYEHIIGGSCDITLIIAICMCIIGVVYCLYLYIKNILGL